MVIDNLVPSALHPTPQSHTNHRRTLPGERPYKSHLTVRKISTDAFSFAYHKIMA
ncbi:MAG: hypothetical protein HDS56_04150 [Barnesiella sp.]|nr:hypothetical protein [Barnesiella sp.]